MSTSPPPEIKLSLFLTFPELIMIFPLAIILPYSVSALLLIFPVSILPGTSVVFVFVVLLL